MTPHDVELARLSPAGWARLASRGTYVFARHVRLVARAIVDTIATGGRLLVMLPPRHGKSALVSRATPAWFLGLFPDRHVILASYEADFARGFGRQARRDMEEYGPATFDLEIASDSSAADRWELSGHEGSMRTCGVGGPMTGRGAHLLIVDDPVKNAVEAFSTTHRQKTWDWWQSTADTRIEPGGAAIVLMTRWHEDDLAGRLLREEPGLWNVVRLPAIAEEEGDPLGRQVGEALWPERWPAESFARHRARPYWWDALYQQRPAPLDGGIFRKAWLEQRYVVEADGVYRLPSGNLVRLEHLRRFCAVDLATSTKTSADFTVIATVGVAADGTMLVLDVDRARREGPDIVPAIATKIATWKASAVWIEKAGFQLSLIQEARRRGLPVLECTPDRDKVARALPLAAALQGGQVLLPRYASWVTDLEIELLAFGPGCRNDDQVDALAYAVLQRQSGFGQWVVSL